MKKAIKNIFFIFLVCFSYQAFGQCVEASFDVPDCITPNSTVTFFNTSIDNSICNNVEYEWALYDENSNFISGGLDFDFDYTFTLSGIYYLEIYPDIPGQNAPCCPNTSNGTPSFGEYITVIDLPLSLNTSNSIEICSNGSIDYDSLFINIQNDIGNISYDWVTIPNGIQWEDFENQSIPDSENEIILTITDNATGCSDSQIIDLNFTQTNADASFTSSSATLTCQGQQFSFSVDNFNDSLFDYNWFIDGSPQISIYDSILTTNIFANSNEVEVNLQVIDNQTGCLVNEFFYITVNTLTNYVDVNTDIEETDDNGFDEGFNSFWYCSPDSITIDTLYNIFNDTTGIDSVLIDLGVAGSQMYYDSDGYEYFIISVSEPVSQINITSYTQGGCPPTTISYGILYNQEINAGNVNFGACSSINLCRGDTLLYFIDPQQFQMPLNATVDFTIICSDDSLDVVTWDYQDFTDNLYLVDADCNPNTPDVLKYVFPYVYEESSCGCNFVDDFLGPIFDIYRIIPIFNSYCQEEVPMTLGLLQNIPPDPTAFFTVEDSVCAPAVITLANNSTFGCANSLDPSYNPNSQPYSVIQPSFYYNFGNCEDSLYTPTQSQYQNGNYSFISTTYNEAGLYLVEVGVVNACTTIFFNDTITIFPDPLVEFQAENECFGDTVYFFSTANNRPDTTTTIQPCQEVIDVPEGFNIATYFWDFGDGNTSTQENPFHIYQSPGDYEVTLTVTDSLSFYNPLTQSCEATYTETITIYELPQIVVEVPPVCSGLESEVINNTLEGDTTIILWDWSFPGSSTFISSSSEFIDSLFYNPDCDPISNPSLKQTYTIDVNVEDAYGCKHDTTFNTTIFCTPEANFIAGPACENQTTQFTNTSSPSSNMNWEWDFGDNTNTTSPDFQPEYNYQNCNIDYTVTLTMWDQDSLCTDTYSDIAELNCLPEANFTSVPDCSGDTILLFGTFTPGESNQIINWIWGDNFFQTIDGSDSSYLISDTCGNNLIGQTLRVQDGNECFSPVVSNPIEIYCNPEVTISSDDVCEEDISSFIGISQFGTSQQITSSIWNLDGSYSLQNGSISDSIISVIYNDCDPNPYEVSFSIEDANTCQATDTLYHYVVCNAVANILTPDDSLCGPASFNISADPNSYNGSYHWSWSPNEDLDSIYGASLTYSGGQTADPNPEANFPENTSQNAIEYEFQLETWVDEIFIDSTGLQCSDYDSLFVTIFPRPLASAIPSATDSCGPFVVNFTNTSNPYNGEDISSMSFEWYVDGQLIDSTQNFTYTFNSAEENDTTYLVELYATSQHDCFDSASFTITVYPDPIAEIILNPAFDSLNCEGFIISDTIIWASDDYEINNDTYNWTYYDQNGNILVPTVSSTDANSAPAYPAPDQGDSIRVVLTVTNDHGCIESTDEIWFYTYVHPITSFSVDSVCHNLESVFENNTQEGDAIITTWNWTIDGGGQPTGLFSDSTISYLYNDPGLYTEELTATDANGCSTTYTLDSITVWQNPEVIISTSDEDCQGVISEFEAIITPGSNQNINSISWDLDLSVQDSILFGSLNDSIIHVLYASCDTFNIQIEVIDGFDCISIDSTTYEVYCNNAAELILSDSTICLNNEITTSLAANSNITSEPPGVGVFNITGSNLTTLTFPNTAITDSINYQLILTVGGNTNCPAIDTNIVTVYPTPLASAIPSAIDSCGPFVVNFNNN
ncbi:MAG: hypothetical protein CMP75_01710, partial [Flavobacteriales bacterium]|nr:hypothetical protein [Flavobacteriales bacterium]